MREKVWRTVYLQKEIKIKRSLLKVMANSIRLEEKQ